MKEKEPMDQLDAITLLYLLKTGDKPASPLDCCKQFQRTRAELEAAVQDADPLASVIESGKFGM